jgi:hypothetical protein
MLSSFCAVRRPVLNASSHLDCRAAPVANVPPPHVIAATATVRVSESRLVAASKAGLPFLLQSEFLGTRAYDRGRQIGRAPAS